jgi:KaiC/GvpD/RAD55 family RecA-like ATPase
MEQLNGGSALANAAQTMECVVGLLRILWFGNPPDGAPGSSWVAATRTMDLVERLAAECPNTPDILTEAIASRWRASIQRDDTEKRWGFRELCELLVPQSILPEDIRYFAMRAIRVRYEIPFASRTARLAHELAAAMAEFPTAAEATVGFTTVWEALGKAMERYSPRYRDIDRESFLAVCLVLGLVETTEGAALTVRAECGDPEYLLGHVFGVPTTIPGFDSLFGGGGLMLADTVSGRPPSSGLQTRRRAIGGRAVLCLGRFGSGKTLLSLQFAVEVARKGGVAWVLALEQTEAECLYALETIGVSTTDACFDLVLGGLTESFRALSHPAPARGALVFLRPGEDAGEYTQFLDTMKERLSWMSSYPLRLLVLDPVNAFVQTKGEQSSIRTKTRSLFEAAKRENVNLWFTSEEGASGRSEENRFEENIADTVIHLASENLNGQQRRFVEVTKSRFQRESAGRHGFVIESQRGIHIYPSSAIITQLMRVQSVRNNKVRIEFGIPGMERLLGPEPLSPGDVVVLAGPGKAKTLMGVHFMAADAGAVNSRSVFVSDYSPQRMERFLKKVLVQTPERADAIVRCCVPTGYVDPGRILQQIRETLERCRGAQQIRLLITNLGRWEQEMPFVAQDAQFGTALVSLIRAYNATAVVVCGDSLERGSSLRDTVYDQADFLLHLHRREFQGRVTTLLSAIKTRNMRHQRESFELGLEADSVRIWPAPLFRTDATGNVEPVPISLFLHSETKNHQRHNQRLLQALIATISPTSKIRTQSRRFDVGLLSLNRFSAVDELQVFQIDEFQLPTVRASSSKLDVFYAFDTASNMSVLADRVPDLRNRVLLDNGKRFLAVPLYMNISFLAVDSRHMTETLATNWEDLAKQCTEWEGRQRQRRNLFFSCPVYEESVETYNCLFLEILSSLRRPGQAEYDDLPHWFEDGLARKAAYLFRRLCRRSHQLGYQKDRRPNALVARHWYNTLNQEFSTLSPQRRSDFVVQSLFGETTTAGEWYLAVPSHSASPEVALRLIEQLTIPARETSRVELGVGLPTRHSYYNAEGLSEASVSHYFNFTRSDVQRLMGNAIRRSEFRLYQRYATTISSHLHWILEMPEFNTEKAEQDEINRTMDSLVSNLRFLQSS